MDEPSTPAPVTEHELTVGRDVTAPPERVWAVLTDLRAAADTLTGVEEVQVLTDGPYAVGTRWRETRKVLGVRSTAEMVVTAADPWRSTVVEATSRGTDYTTTFGLEPIGEDITHLTMRFAARGTRPGRVARAVMRVAGPLTERSTRRMLERDLADIAAAAESGPGLSPR